MKKIIILSLAILSVQANIAHAQNSLKRDKQATVFNYVQANLHYGYNKAQGGSGEFNLPRSGPANRLVYQFLSKNQRVLQKGYVRVFALNGFRARFSLDFRGSLLDEEKSNTYALRLQNFGASFKTRWDRTSVFVGYGNVKFGHNPKIDPVTNFTANSTKMDLGFSQDLGITFRTPLSPNMDLEVATYSGGVFNKPLLTYERDHAMAGEEMTVSTGWEAMDLTYDNNWLITGRVGTPQFKHFEYGAMVMAGRVLQGDGSSKSLRRIGADAIVKFQELLKASGQVAVGDTEQHSEGTRSTDLNIGTNIEYYLKGMFIFNTSNAIMFVNERDNELDNHSSGQLVNSATYVVSPHTRVRLNHFVNYYSDGDDNWGLTMQLVTGFGKR